MSLPLLTPPSSNSYVNTPSVAENADAVRTRLREYIQFGALLRLPADTPLLTEGLRIQPLHVIIKAGKKAAPCHRPVAQPQRPLTVRPLPLQLRGRRRGSLLPRLLADGRCARVDDSQSWTMEVSRVPLSFDAQFSPSNASRPPLSSVCTTLVAWARSRRFRQIGPHSVSFLLPFLFLWPFNSLFISFGGGSACSGRYCRPLARPELLSGLIAQLLSSVSCLMPCLCTYTCFITPVHRRSSAERRYEKLPFLFLLTRSLLLRV